MKHFTVKTFFFLYFSLFYSRFFFPLLILFAEIFLHFLQSYSTYSFFYSFEFFMEIQFIEYWIRKKITKIKKLFLWIITIFNYLLWQVVKNRCDCTQTRLHFFFFIYSIYINIIIYILFLYWRFLYLTNQLFFQFLLSLPFILIFLVFIL